MAGLIDKDHIARNTVPAVDPTHTGQPQLHVDDLSVAASDVEQKQKAKKRKQRDHDEGANQFTAKKHHKEKKRATDDSEEKKTKRRKHKTGDSSSEDTERRRRKIAGYIPNPDNDPSLTDQARKGA